MSLQGVDEHNDHVNNIDTSTTNLTAMSEPANVSAQKSDEISVDKKRMLFHDTGSSMKTILDSVPEDCDVVKEVPEKQVRTKAGRLVSVFG